MGCRAFLQGIFPAQGSNLCLLHCKRILYRLSAREARIADPLFPPPASHPDSLGVLRGLQNSVTSVILKAQTLAPSP